MLGMPPDAERDVAAPMRILNTDEPQFQGVKMMRLHRNWIFDA